MKHISLQMLSINLFLLHNHVTPAHINRINTAAYTIISLSYSHWDILYCSKPQNFMWIAILIKINRIQTYHIPKNSLFKTLFTRRFQ